MARDYARIMTAIWRNKEFLALGESEQRGYLLLVTQPDISAAGVLALRLRRWADMSGDSTVDSLARVLKALEAGRFIVVDWTAEELLIRSFIRWDGGFNNPKRRPVIVRAGAEVTSSAIRGHLDAEFRRCGIPVGPDSPPPTSSDVADSQADSLSGSPSKIIGHDPPLEPFPQVDSLSDSVSASDGVVVALVSTETTTHNPQNSTPTASRDEPDVKAPTAQDLVGEWIDLCRKRPPGNVIGQAAKTIKGMLEEGIDPDDIRSGIPVWVAKGLHPAALPAVVNECMNANPSAVPRTVKPRQIASAVALSEVDAAFAELEQQAKSAQLHALPRGA